MAKARRCGARTRAGHPCRQAAVTDRARCRMHGWASMHLSRRCDTLRRAICSYPWVDTDRGGAPSAGGQAREKFLAEHPDKVDAVNGCSRCVPLYVTHWRERHAAADRVGVDSRGSAAFHASCCLF
ncbi:MAG: HGGxSTG domain-containing protein [Xanthobacteraceae bacterium]